MKNEFMNMNQKGITFLTAVIIVAFLFGATGCTVVKQQENNKQVGEQSNAKLFIETMQKVFNENYQIVDSSKEISFLDPSGGSGPSIKKILKGYSFIYNASIAANHGSYMREKIGPTPAWLASEMTMGYINDKIICIQSDATPGLDSPRYSPKILQRGPEIFCADLTPATAASDWKTYTSAARGFSIKYPPQWYIYDYPGATYVNLQSYQNDPAPENGLSKGQTKIQVSAYSKPQSESLRSFVSRPNELTGGAPKVEAFTIAGIQGFKNDYVGNGVYYFPSSETEGISIMLWSASLEISGQILETLKFVPPVAQNNNASLQLTPSPAPTPVKGWLEGSNLQNLNLRMAQPDLSYSKSAKVFKLSLTDKTVCVVVRSIKAGDFVSFSCLSPKPLSKWGIGDRVRVTGQIGIDTITVSNMEIISSLPLSQW